MKPRSLTRHALPLVCALAVGCTFGGVSVDLPPDCRGVIALTKDATLAADPCNSLNDGNTTCTRFQCDKDLGKCVKGALDFDRDGEPSIACGGKDCDDEKPTRSSVLKETCDGLDNDCNGVADEDLLKRAQNASPVGDVTVTAGSVSLSSNNGKEVYAAYNVAAGCVGVVNLADLAAKPAECAFGAQTDNAEHPWVRPIGPRDNRLASVAFTRKDAACAGTNVSRLVFATKQSAGAVNGDCGASLPSLAEFGSADAAQPVVIGFYGAPAKCGDAPVALRLRWVKTPLTTPDLTSSSQAQLTLNAVGLRAPSAVALEGTDFVLVAAAADTSVAIWGVRADASVVPFAANLFSLAGATSASLAIGKGRLAIAAEIGCAAGNKIVLALAKLDPAGPTIAPADVTADVSVLGNNVSQSTVTWIEKRSEWWVTWIATDTANGKTLFLRRFNEAGAPAGAAIDLGPAVDAAVRADAYIDASHGVPVGVVTPTSVVNLPVSCQ
ncbi:MAG: polymerase alpha subunit [Myxococcaceae bacterium]|nr:polymerase alpha subunit [Myxococcaceae bacterium]